MEGYNKRAIDDGMQKGELKEDVVLVVSLGPEVEEDHGCTPLISACCNGMTEVTCMCLYGRENLDCNNGLVLVTKILENPTLENSRCLIGLQCAVIK